MSVRPKRGPQQKKGDAGESLVSFLVEETGAWVARKQERDYGVDLELELAEGELQGHILKVQVKTGFRSKVDTLFVPVEASTIGYAEASRVPMVLIAADVENREAYYVWLQHWIYEAKRTGKLRRNTSKFVIKVPRRNTLKSGLFGPLKEIAKAATKTQFVMGLADMMGTAQRLGLTDFAQELITLLKRADESAMGMPFESLIEELAQVATHRSVVDPEIRNAISLLQSVALSIGNKLTVHQIEQLVENDGGYSRIGVNILSRLYDEYPEHMTSLGLPNLFASRGQTKLTYFCGIKERYPGISMSTLLCDEDTDWVYAGYALDFDDHLLDRLAMRGDSYILDLMFPAEQLLGDGCALGRTARMGRRDEA